MNFCSHCGTPVNKLIPPGDNRKRFVCNNCDTIHYQNPNNVVGAILTRGDKILLCKRAIRPGLGLWTLPAGFMENHESVHQAAARECIEEAHAQPGHLSLFGVFSMPYISQVHLMFVGELLSDNISPGIESLEVGLFNRGQIPWNNIAFPVIKHCLKLFYAQNKCPNQVHQARFSRLDNREIEIHTEI